MIMKPKHNKKRVCRIIYVNAFKRMILHIWYQSKERKKIMGKWIKIQCQQLWHLDNFYYLCMLSYVCICESGK